jgi:hypothetical protein
MARKALASRMIRESGDRPLEPLPTLLRGTRSVRHGVSTRPPMGPPVGVFVCPPSDPLRPGKRSWRQTSYHTRFVSRHTAAHDTIIRCTVVVHPEAAPVRVGRAADFSTCVETNGNPPQCWWIAAGVMRHSTRAPGTVREKAHPVSDIPLCHHHSRRDRTAALYPAVWRGGTVWAC